MNKIKIIICLVLTSIICINLGSKEAFALDTTKYDEIISMGETVTDYRVGLQEDQLYYIYLVNVPHTMNVKFNLTSNFNDSHYFKIALYDSNQTIKFLNLDYSSDSEDYDYYNEYNKGEWSEDPVTGDRTFTYTCKLKQGKYYLYLAKNDLLKNDTFYENSFSLDYPTNDIYYDLNVTGSFSLKAGETTSLKNWTSMLKNSKYKWSSTNNSVATISKSGTITAKKSGTTKIKLLIGSSTVWYITVKVK